MPRVWCDFEPGVEFVAEFDAKRGAKPNIEVVPVRARFAATVAGCGVTARVGGDGAAVRRACANAAGR
jgi:hypothetical protein